MKDEEIIKALGLCFNINHNAGLNCVECPYKKDKCSLALYNDTIDLINRQQAEIEKLKNNIQYFYSEEHMEQMEFEKKAIEYNAISKFAEKVENKLGIPFMVNNQVVGIVLDETIKEMVGADNG